MLDFNNILILLTLNTISFIKINDCTIILSSSLDSNKISKDDTKTEFKNQNIQENKHITSAVTIQSPVIKNDFILIKKQHPKRVIPKQLRKKVQIENSCNIRLDPLNLSNYDQVLKKNLKCEFKMENNDDKIDMYLCCNPVKCVDDLIIIYMSEISYLKFKFSNNIKEKNREPEFECEKTMRKIEDVDWKCAISRNINLNKKEDEDYYCSCAHPFRCHIKNN